MSEAKISTLDDNESSASPAIATIGTKKKPAEKAAELAVSVDGLSGKKVCIVVHQGEGDLGREPVFIGLNGYSYLINRGEKVTVPVEVKDILDNAVTVHLENTKTGLVERRVPRHMVSTHG